MHITVAVVVNGMNWIAELSCCLDSLLHNMIHEIISHIANLHNVFLFLLLVCLEMCLCASICSAQLQSSGPETVFLMTVIMKSFKKLVRTHNRKHVNLPSTIDTQRFAYSANGSMVLPRLSTQVWLTQSDKEATLGCFLWILVWLSSYNPPTALVPTNWCQWCENSQFLQLEISEWNISKVSFLTQRVTYWTWNLEFIIQRWWRHASSVISHTDSMVLFNMWTYYLSVNGCKKNSIIRCYQSWFPGLQWKVLILDMSFYFEL